MEVTIVKTLTPQTMNQIRLYRRVPPQYGAKFCEEICKEAHFERTGEIPELSREIGFDVAEGRIPCPLCEMTLEEDSTVKHRIPLLHRGRTTGLEVNLYVICPCRMYGLFYDRWFGGRSMIGLRYQGIQFAKLLPDSRIKLPIEAPAQIIGFLQDHPDDCYFFCGGTGTGKTTYQAALFQEALSRWARWAYRNPKGVIEGVWRISASALVRQHVDWRGRVSSGDPHEGEIGELLRPARPLVCREDILAVRDQGFRPSLFLDDIDRVVMADPEKAVIFDLIDAVYESNGQLVVCANSPLTDLESILGDRIGQAIIRRIMNSQQINSKGLTYGRVLDFFQSYWTDGRVAQMP